MITTMLPRYIHVEEMGMLFRLTSNQYRELLTTVVKEQVNAGEILYRDYSAAIVGGVTQVTDMAINDAAGELERLYGVSQVRAAA